MTAHQQFAEDLALYAMGALGVQESQALEQHLEGCSACRRELESLRGDAALLGFAAERVAPSASVRQSLLSAIEQEPRRRKPARARSWIAIPSFVAAALAIVALLLWQGNMQLRRDVADLQSRLAADQKQRDEVERLVAALRSPETTRVTLVSIKTQPQPQGKVFYLRPQGTLIFIASNMPPLPAQKAYELWLIPPGGVPIPAGLFKPDANGGATVVNPPLPLGVEAKTFAITIEPESGSPGPTSQPIMAGSTP